MPFIFPSSKEEKKSSSLSKDELFEIFMLEIGQYTRTSDWGVELTWPYMSIKDTTDKFKDWLKKKS